MNKVDLTKTKFSSKRSKFRKEIIKIFLKEVPGTGKGILASRYKYIVKKLKDGRKVFLSRPAIFNNGFDFTVNVSKTNFNSGTSKKSSKKPTHQNIINDLILKKQENTLEYNLLFKQITRVFNCKKPTKTTFSFTSGHPTDLILECLVWLFLEQDVTYWNYSGRHMLFDHLKAI
ncbi:MAG: DNA adenine methylase [Bacteroidia bacterium]